MRHILTSLGNSFRPFRAVCLFMTASNKSRLGSIDQGMVGSGTNRPWSAALIRSSCSDFRFRLSQASFGGSWTALEHVQNAQWGTFTVDKAQFKWIWSYSWPPITVQVSYNLNQFVFGTTPPQVVRFHRNKWLKFLLPQVKVHGTIPQNVGKYKG